MDNSVLATSSDSKVAAVKGECMCAPPDLSTSPLPADLLLAVHGPRSAKANSLHE
jgi:hypothetical protein